MKHQKTVVLGLSGGVDSSVAALLLQKQGYRVIAVFLKLYSDTKNPLTGECAYLDDLKMARKIALQLKIPFHIMDFEKEYRHQVLQPMFNAYKKGLTPNPDLACNTLMKFPLLQKAAQKSKAEFIATGHYARIKKSKQGYRLLTGKDKSKDQSYFLADLSQSDLQRTLFPLGALTKKEVRILAKKHRLPNWDKHGTVGICFVEQQNMHQLLKTRISPKKGSVFLPSGKQIGTHEGIALYTIGQKALPRFGIYIDKPVPLAQKRLYVAAKNVGKNVLIVAPASDPILMKQSMVLKKVHWINLREKLPMNMKVRIRHLGKRHTGMLAKKKFWTWTFYLPREAAAPGQIAVFSKGEQILGCAEIV